MNSYHKKAMSVNVRYDTMIMCRKVNGTLVTVHADEWRGIFEDHIK